MTAFEQALSETNSKDFREMVNSPAWRAFMAGLHMTRANEAIRLLNEDDMKMIHRLQGSLRTIDTVPTIAENVELAIRKREGTEDED